LETCLARFQYFRYGDCSNDIPSSPATLHQGHRRPERHRTAAADRLADRQLRGDSDDQGADWRFESGQVLGLAAVTSSNLSFRLTKLVQQ